MKKKEPKKMSFAEWSKKFGSASKAKALKGKYYPKSRR